jgi:hypothetical protein
MLAFGVDTLEAAIDDTRSGGAPEPPDSLAPRRTG